jgi:hypothetical protein
MPLVPTTARLKLVHTCDRRHSSRVFIHLTGWHCKLGPNTEGLVGSMGSILSINSTTTLMASHNTEGPATPIQTTVQYTAHTAGCPAHPCKHHRCHHHTDQNYRNCNNLYRILVAAAVVPTLCSQVRRLQLVVRMHVLTPTAHVSLLTPALNPSFPLPRDAISVVAEFMVRMLYPSRCHELPQL